MFRFPLSLFGLTACFLFVWLDHILFTHSPAGGHPRYPDILDVMNDSMPLEDVSYAVLYSK